jgi:hypothetical protein
MSDIERRSGRELANACDLSAGEKGDQQQANRIDHLPGVKESGQPQGGAVDRAREAEARDAKKGGPAECCGSPPPPFQ